MTIVAALDAAIETTARADAGVIAAFAASSVRLYPLDPPTNPIFPFVLYRAEIVGDDTECADGAEAYLIFDVYAREATYALSATKAANIAAALRAAFTAPITITGHVVDDWTFEGDRPISDPVENTAHRQVRIRYLTTATA